MKLKKEYSKYFHHGFPSFFTMNKIRNQGKVPLLPEIEPWTFEQHVGEAVIIPAGCPYQIRSPKVRNTALI